mmetsp:Transcript_5151/g.7731  ORF Transcript_5151/g.7731 Transcript_5151/m.7731 type:complete len:81 (+) Transcript_5151:1412-1654(+)
MTLDDLQENGLHGQILCLVIGLCKCWMKALFLHPLKEKKSRRKKERKKKGLKERGREREILLLFLQTNNKDRTERKTERD